MTDELKSCPFCGEPAKIIESHRYDASVDPTPPHWKVSCATIGCNGAAINIWRQSPEDAIAAWNSRHESDTLPTWAIEAIENEVGQNLNKRSQLFYCGFVQALNWVLALRKPEETE